MHHAMCPYCGQKLQLPDQLPADTMLQCAKCEAQFLPPDPSIEAVIYSPRKKKKRNKISKSQGWTRRSVILVTSLSTIMVLLSLLLIFWLMQPGYARFNEQLLSNYNKFNAVLQSSVQQQPTNNISAFLRQFDQLGTRLRPILEDVRAMKAPEDVKHILSTMTNLIESMIQFSQQDVPKLLSDLTKNPGNDAGARDLFMSLMRISELHDSLLRSQNAMAQQHGLYQMQAPRNAQFFLTRSRP